MIKEQYDSNIDSNIDSTDSCPTKKQQLTKKRMIRKEKNKKQSEFNVVDLKSIDTSKLTRQQKAKLQKAKNRQAAQKSRDIHKQYVTSLQQQNQRLKKEIEQSRKYCFKCQVELDTEPISNQQDQTVDYFKEMKSSDNLFMEPESQHFPFNSTQNDFIDLKEDRQDSWIRHQQNPNNSWMKMMLFVCMIAIAVFIVGGGSQKDTTLSAPPRVLIEIQDKASEETNYTDQKLDFNKTKMASESVYTISPNGLVALNAEIDREACLSSLVPQYSQIQTSLTRINQDKEYNSYTNKPFLLCTLQSPKILQTEKIHSPIESSSSLVKLFLMGSEMKELTGYSRWLRDIQLNGIYRVQAEVKGIEKVQDHHCLL